MRNSLRAYVVAIIAGAAAVLLRWLLDPLLGNSLPLVTLFGAVAVAVWAGGYGPAIVTALGGYVVAAIFFIEPRGLLVLDQPDNLVGFIAYLLTCALIIAIGTAMRRAQERKTAEAAKLLASEATAALAQSTEAALATQTALETERAGRALVEKQLADERARRVRVETELTDAQQSLDHDRHQIWPAEMAPPRRGPAPGPEHR